MPEGAHFIETKETSVLYSQSREGERDQRSLRFGFECGAECLPPFSFIINLHFGSPTRFWSTLMFHWIDLRRKTRGRRRLKFQLQIHTLLIFSESIIKRNDYLYGRSCYAVYRCPQNVFRVRKNVLHLSTFYEKLLNERKVQFVIISYESIDILFPVFIVIAISRCSSVYSNAIIGRYSPSPGTVSLNGTLTMVQAGSAPLY